MEGKLTEAEAAIATFKAGHVGIKSGMARSVMLYSRHFMHKISAGRNSK